MSTNCSDESSAIFVRCDCDIPKFFCGLANVSGYCSTVIWFLVLVPQVFRNFRHSTVEGVSPAWAIANFTASLNNAFFIFILGNMPWYTYGSAVYMPLLEGALLLQFMYYTKKTKLKFFVSGLCVVAWIVIVILQLAFDISQQLEWVSIALWSAETIPQVFMNMNRRSTYGLSKLSIAITAWGKITDFVENYLLLMPQQYVVMAFFSSSTAQFGTVQVLWYWNQRPSKKENGEEDLWRLEREPIRPACNFLRYLGLCFFILLLLVYAVAFVIRLKTLWAITGPVALYILYAALFAFVTFRRRFEQRRTIKPN